MTIMNDNELIELIFSNEKLRTLLSEFGYFVVDIHGSRVVANTLFQHFGYSEMDMTLDHDWTNNIHPEDKADVLVNRENIIEQKSEDIFEYTYRYRKKNGEYAWILSAGKYLQYDQHGAPNFLVGCEVDVTEFKETEQQLIRAKLNAERLAKESDTLLKIGATITSSLELNETATAILKEIRNLVVFDVGVVFLLKDDQLHAVSAYDTQSDALMDEIIGDKVDIQDRRSFYSVIANYNKSLLCQNIALDFPHFQHLDAHQEIQSIIGVPLSSKGKVIGVMQLGNYRKNAFTLDEYDTITKFSNNIAIALENAMLHERLSVMALKDPLTNIDNRRGLYLHWETILQQAIRHKRSTSLIITDIDHFKCVNDQYGHDVGDQVIREVATVLKNTTRVSDIVSRYGGEEFIVVLPETELDEAVMVAQKIADAVKGHKFDGLEKGLTVSAGVHCEQLKEPTPIDTLIKGADKQLYQAKANGRACVFPKYTDNKAG